MTMTMTTIFVNHTATTLPCTMMTTSSITWPPPHTYVDDIITIWMTTMTIYIDHAATTTTLPSALMCDQQQ